MLRHERAYAQLALLAAVLLVVVADAPAELTPEFDGAWELSSAYFGNVNAWNFFNVGQRQLVSIQSDILRLQRPDEPGPIDLNIECVEDPEFEGRLLVTTTPQGEDFDLFPFASECDPAVWSYMSEPISYPFYDFDFCPHPPCIAISHTNCADTGVWYLTRPGAVRVDGSTWSAIKAAY